MKKRHEKIIEDCKECPGFRKPTKKLVFCDLSCLATPHVNGEGISKYCPLPDAQNTREN